MWVSYESRTALSPFDVKSLKSQEWKCCLADISYAILLIWSSQKVDQLTKPTFRSRYVHTPVTEHYSERPMDTVASTQRMFQTQYNVFWKTVSYVVAITSINCRSHRIMTTRRITHAIFDHIVAPLWLKMCFHAILLPNITMHLFT